jgi:hypothetical protein
MKAFANSSSRCIRNRQLQKKSDDGAAVHLLAGSASIKGNPPVCLQNGAIAAATPVTYAVVLLRNEARPA